LLNYLSNLGFPTSELAVLKNDFSDVINSVDNWKNIRDAIEYEVDGVVVKINDLQLADDLGFVGKDPRGSIALKFPAKEATTRVEDIKVNVGRTGVLTPYEVLEPVEIGGVIVERATLHNFDFIAEKDIRPGDRVLVKRAGEVIPYVIGPVVDARTGEEKPYTPPAACPACGQPVEHFEGEVAWYCVNAACPAQLIRNVEHFVSRGAMDIVGLGIKIVEKLIEAGKVKDVADIFTLNREDILEAVMKKDRKTKAEPPGKIAENLLASINTSKSRPLNRLLSSLGIRGVGEVMASDLARHYPNLDALSRATADGLQEIEGVGPNIAAAIVDWFARPANQNLLKKLKATGVWPVSQLSVTSDQSTGSLAGLTFVVTGTLASFTRDGLKEFIQANGGKVVGAISRNTDYLVLGENPGSKFDKARELEVKIINEEELRRLTT